MKEVKGYFTATGYYGWINGRYKLYSSESEYFEEIEEEDLYLVLFLFAKISHPYMERGITQKVSRSV